MTVIMAVGDLVVEHADSRPLFAASEAVLRDADLLIGQLEIPHLDSGVVQSTDVPAVPGPPSALDGIAAAGFDLLTLAGNHVYDFGYDGITTTRALCEERGMRTAGTGLTIDEALLPAVHEHDGRRIAVLSINCVGPRESWATSTKPGAAYIEVVTHYEPRGANPGGPPRISTFAERVSLGRAVRAVQAAAAESDTVIVALHKGLVHMPAQIAEYEFEIAHAMVDAGASAVISHHAHIMRGVEIYRGAPIFHGLGNYVTVTRALASTGSNTPERARWARDRRRLFGFEPDPAMPEYPFHPESRNTAIAVMDVSTSGVSASLIPCWIDDRAVPVPLLTEEEARPVADYLREITAEADLDTRLHWEGGRLVVLPPADDDV